MAAAVPGYRGRVAPSPTGFLHLGHARTFWTAQRRALEQKGALVLRSEDLDRCRVRPEFVTAMMEDLRWLGIQWQEGPDCGGLCAPYAQSERAELYESAFHKLQMSGLIYPCNCSRADVRRSLGAPHSGEDEPIYPGRCRPPARPAPGGRISWRFCVPDGQTVSFIDGFYGTCEYVAGRDFGDFVIWRHDGLPSYQLSVVVDDAAMAITEVVRGRDLLLSTARQILLYRALNLTVPGFYHCPLVTDEQGVRLAKRNEALSLRTLRAQGISPADLISRFFAESFREKS